jgi:hypothetical protein
MVESELRSQRIGAAAGARVVGPAGAALATPLAAARAAAAAGRRAGAIKDTAGTRREYNARTALPVGSSEAAQTTLPPPLVMFVPGGTLADANNGRDMAGSSNTVSQSALASSSNHRLPTHLPGSMSSETLGVRWAQPEQHLNVSAGEVEYEGHTPQADLLDQLMDRPSPSRPSASDQQQPGGHVPRDTMLQEGCDAGDDGSDEYNEGLGCHTGLGYMTSR